MATPDEHIPNAGAATEITLPGVMPIPLDLTRVTEDHPGAGDITMGERIRGVWSVVEKYGEEMIQVAEVTFGRGTGDTKKLFVVDKMMAFLQELEGRIGLIPNWIEPVVFFALRKAADLMVERLLAGLKARNVL